MSDLQLQRAAASTELPSSAQRLQRAIRKMHVTWELPILLQVAVFDLELQAPAASTKLPGGRPAFQSILGVFGHASAGGSLLSSGLDTMYCLHQVSTWTSPLPCNP